MICWSHQCIERVAFQRGVHQGIGSGGLLREFRLQLPHKSFRSIGVGGSGRERHVTLETLQRDRMRGGVLLREQSCIQQGWRVIRIPLQRGGKVLARIPLILLGVYDPDTIQRFDILWFQTKNLPIGGLGQIQAPHAKLSRGQFV